MDEDPCRVGGILKLSKITTMPQIRKGIVWP